MFPCYLSLICSFFFGLCLRSTSLNQQFVLCLGRRINANKWLMCILMIAKPIKQILCPIQNVFEYKEDFRFVVVRFNCGLSSVKKSQSYHGDYR